MIESNEQPTSAWGNTQRLHAVEEWFMAEAQKKPNTISEPQTSPTLPLDQLNPLQMEHYLRLVTCHVGEDDALKVASQISHPIVENRLDQLPSSNRARRA